MHSDLDLDDNLTGALARLAKQQAERIGSAVRTGARDPKEVLREVLNTVGRPGQPGEPIRCVVSVSMLTEGWDARTVTHVLGFRKFGTQLLCEQVTGRALRRSSYENFDQRGCLRPEYAEVLGAPFDFMPSAGSNGTKPPPPRYAVHTVSGRPKYRISFPRLTGYAVEPGQIRLRLDPRHNKS